MLSSGFWGWALPFLPALLLFGFIAVKYGWKEKTRRANRLRGMGINPIAAPEPMGSTTAMLPTAMTTKVIARNVSKAGLAAFLLFSGYLVGNLESKSAKAAETYSMKYTDVLVVARHDSNHFAVHPARMGTYEWTTCVPVDWQPNEKMEFVKYQQNTGCKDVGAGGVYKFYSLGGKRLTFSQEIADVR